MKPVCIIPARGSSKRLPRKNILPVAGEPILSLTIKSAIKSKCFDQVFVSSEDDEILEIAAVSGANPFKRDDSLAGDRSTVVEVCLDLLEKLQYDKFCCLYATSVLLRWETIVESYKKFHFYLRHDTNVLMGVSKYNYSPVQALKVEKDASARLLYPEFKSIQSQFHPKTRVSNGTFYWSKVSTFFEEKTFYSNKLKLFDVPEKEVCDIDTMEDYERLLKAFSKNNS